MRTLLPSVAAIAALTLSPAPAAAQSKNAGKTHVRHILSKLGVQSRTQAALYAIRSGLISPEQGKMLREMP